VADRNEKPARDLILIGGSAGAIEALINIFRAFPADFPAAILICIHTSPESPSVLPRVLARAGALPAKSPADGDPLRHGEIYVAAPDHHLVLGEGDVVRVRRGPRENGHRPAIDPLFRSAAIGGYASRCIGIVLSGYLDDGAAGLHALRSRGGLAIVQDPDDAIAADMPANTINYAGADYVLTAREIGARLPELVQQPSKVIPMNSRNKNKKKKAPAAESTRAAQQPNAKQNDNGLGAPNELVTTPEEGEGTPSVFACPECHGVLWEIKEGAAVRYRCRVGHGYSEATLNQDLNHAAETALWAAMRALDEKAAMSRRMADAATGPARWAARLREQAETYAEHADILRRMIIGEPTPAEEPAETRETPHTA